MKDLHNFLEIKVSTGVYPHLLLDCSGLNCQRVMEEPKNAIITNKSYFCLRVQVYIVIFIYIFSYWRNNTLVTSALIIFPLKDS